MICVVQKFSAILEALASNGPLTPSTSTSVYICRARYGRRRTSKRPARSRPSTVVNALKIDSKLSTVRFSARLRPWTDVDALGVNAQAFQHVFHIGVDARLHPSLRAKTRVETGVDGRRRSRCEWALIARREKGCLK